MKANIKKAIIILDALAESHQNRAEGMRKLCNGWGEDKGPKGLGLEIAKIDETVISCIKLVKECLNEKPNCKHPKKDHDICDGMKYCMNCNENLERVKSKK